MKYKRPQKIIREETVVYDPQCETIQFQFKPDDDLERWFYWIHLQSIEEAGVEWWLRHLGDKRWFTPDIKAKFLKVLDRLNTEEGNDQPKVVQYDGLPF